MAKNDTPEDILRRIIKEGTQTAAVEQAKIALAQLEETKKQTEILDKIEKKKETSGDRSTKEKEEGRLSRVTQRVSSGRGPTRGTMGNIADVISRGTIAASVGNVPDLRGVAAATLDAAGVGGLVTMGGRRGSSSPGGGKNPEKESVGILLSILNVLKDNNELLQDLLYSLTAAAKDRIESAREANRKAGEAGKGVRDEGEDSEEQSSLGKWGTIIAAALGTVYGIIQGWLKTVKYFAEAILPESLIKSIKGKFAAIGTFFDDILKSIKGKFTAIGTFFDDIFMKLKSVFSGRFEKIGAAFEEVFSKITNLFKSVGSESKLGKIISSIGGAIIKLSAPFIEAFNVLKSLISGPANYIVNVFKSFSGIFTGVAGTAGKMMGFLKSFAGVFKFVSSIVSKLALPLFIVMTVWDTVKGMIEGYEKEGIIGAISGAVKGFFNSLIFGPLDLLKKALAWVLGAFGWTKAEKILNSFSFEQVFSDIIDGLIQSIKKMFASITDIFSSKEDTVKKQAEMLKPVKPKPTGRAGVAWEQQYGATHNPDGTPKITKLTPEPLEPVEARPGENEKIKVNTGNKGKVQTTEISAAAEWDKKYKGKYDPITGKNLPQPMFAGSASGNFGNTMAEATAEPVDSMITDDLTNRLDTMHTAGVMDDNLYKMAKEDIKNGRISMATKMVMQAERSIAPGGDIIADRHGIRAVGWMPTVTPQTPFVPNFTTDDQEQPTFTGSASANFDNVMAETVSAGAASANFGNVMAEKVSATDLIPTTNQTAPAFLKRVNDLAVSSSAPAAPIIIDNTTKNNVTNSRPSSISPRVSSGAPKTAPVMSHIDRLLYPFIGAFP